MPRFAHMLAWIPAILMLTAGCGTKDESTDSSAPTPTTGTSSTDSSTSSTLDVCSELGLTVRSWRDDAPSTPSLKAVAGDFTVKTRSGPWTFSENFTGCETYLFIRSNPANWDGEPMWSRDHEDLLRALPENTHLFFVPDSSDPRAELDELEGLMTKAIRRLPPKKEEWWGAGDRIHYVKKTSSELAADGNWVGLYLRSPGWGFGIDRFQKIRDMGSLADGSRSNGSWFDGNLSHAAKEAISYEFESDRQDELDAQQSLALVQLWQAERLESGWGGNDGYIELDIPAATASSRDSLTVEMDMTCDGEGEYGTCPAWDRITTLFVCDEPTEATNPYASQACQEAVAEVPGNCALDGVVDSATTCTTVGDCTPTTGTPTGTYTCEGYAAAIAADTVSCPCADVNGGAYDAARTCNSDGLGYGECRCGCGTEVARWITTYHREGRWTADASFALPWFERGGHFKFRYASIDPYLIDIGLRFHDAGKSARPSETIPLFTGGSFGMAYNDKYDPIDIPIPADATKVELAVIVTGHGMESPGNCAEFCDTQHHFSVNGSENLVDFPWLTTQDPDYLCENMIDQGTVPNQYGTWFYARSNWCPGKQVDPIYIDVTSQVTPGQTATLEYRGDRNGVPYPSDGASIDLSSYLVIHK